MIGILSLFISSIAIAEVDSTIVDSTLQWWNTWEDSHVVQLIEEGLETAPDVSISLARVQQAEALAKQLRSAFLPSVSIAGSMNTQPADALGFGFGLSNLDDLFPTDPNAPVEEEEDSSLFTSGNVALQVGLPLDVWGTGLANQKAATFDAEASELDRLNATRLLSTSIANAYYDALAIHRQYDIVVEQEESAEAMLEISTMRQKRDDATILDVLQQRQQLHALQIQSIRTEQQLQLAEQRLAVLLGRVPNQTDGLIVTTDFPNISVYDDVDINQILNERLDVQSAQRRVSAAEKRRYAAYTQMLPTLALNGQLSRQANYRGEEGAEWNTLDAWSAGGSVNLVLFQGGNKLAALESAEAALIIAEENVRKVRLQAEQEVRQTLLSETQQQKIQSLVDTQMTSAQAAHQEAMNRYQKGLTPYITVLSTQQAHQQASLTQVQSSRDMVRIRLQTIQSLNISSQ
jgi:outer membrane protein TolC